MIINIQQARINTASVEIKTLTINGKQVTLAVFRQLMEKSPFDNDFNITGNIWGMVNYHPDKCAQESSHLHLVWQDNEYLKRFTFYKDSILNRFRSGMYKINELAREYISSLIQEGNINIDLEQNFKINGIDEDFHLSKSQQEYISKTRQIKKSGDSGYSGELLNFFVKDQERYYREVIESIKINKSSREIEKLIHENYKHNKIVEDKAKINWENLSKIDQLFIAV